MLLDVVILRLLFFHNMFLGVESNDMISKKIFKEVYFPGVVFSIIFHMASNTGLDAITIGFVLCGIASPVIVFESVSNITWGVGKQRNGYAAV